VDAIRPGRLALPVLFALVSILPLGCAGDDPVRSTDVTPPGVTTLESTSVDSTRVSLRWSAPGDDGGTGQASVYDLRYAPWLITETDFESASRWTEVSGPRAAGEWDGASVLHLSPGTTYCFALRTADEWGHWSEMSPVLSVTTRGSNSEDAHWLRQPGLFGDVLAMVIHEGQVVAGGGFPGGVARWESGHWTILGAHQDEAEALATYRGELIAAGTFSAGDPVGIHGIAAYDGSTWSPLGAGLTDHDGDPVIRALAVFGDRLIAAGKFSEMDGVAASNVAMWDGSAWGPVGDGLDGGVNALAIHDGKLFAGGEFVASGQVELVHIAAWDGASWSAVGDGFARAVTALGLFDGSLMVAAGGFPGKIAAWGGHSWTDVEGGESFSCVRAMAAYQGRLIVGGSFGYDGASLCPGPFPMIAAWEQGKWHPLGSGLGSWTEDAGVACLLARDQTLWVGGVFLKAGADSAMCVARWED
jgi:hypothetical protein